ncbi:MAG: 16S rRNA processing protein RimM [Calditrichaeota bacterium]|nr:16S rRNA processing protein RimM [Calditrichota bacterium]
MFVVGKILKPHGIKGSVKAEIITSFPEHFLDLEKVFIEQKNQKQAYSIEEVRLSNRFVFIKFVEVNSIEEALELRGRYLYIPEEDLIPLGEDEYYIHELIGMKVFDEHGVLLGTLADVWTFSANDVYVLKTVQGEEKLIPAVKQVVKSVNRQQRIMVIHVMEGMLD